MPRPGRYWIPLDVDYWDHPQIVEAGEPAACLYQRLLGYALRHENDGWIPVRQPRAWYDDWKPRLDALIRVGLVTVGTRNIDVTDWTKWHQPVATRKEREARAVESNRARQKRYRARHHALVLKDQEQEQEQNTHNVTDYALRNALRAAPTGRAAVNAWMKTLQQNEQRTEDRNP